MAADAVIGPVFLSASVPDPRQDPKFFDTADVVGIRDAIIALVSVVLPRTQLVFGGHPAITPMVRLVAQKIKSAHRVRVYQSRYFEGQMPRDNIVFEDVVITPAGKDLDESLLLMRRTMLTENRFSAAFFIGGMQGVVEEHRLLQKTQPDVPCYPVASTGGASLMLLARTTEATPNQLREDLSRNLSYGPLFSKLLGF
jgi:SLOG cluster3 family